MPGEATQQQQTNAQDIAASGVNNDVSAQNVESVDEKGVPFKNRFMEAERKRKALETEIEETKRRLVEYEQRSDEVEKKRLEEEQKNNENQTEEEWKQETRRIYSEEAKKETRISRTIASTLNNLEGNKKIGDLVKAYRNEIEDTISELGQNLRSNPQVIEKAARLVISNHIEEIRAGKVGENVDENSDTISSISTSSTGVSTNNEDSAGGLTPEEEKFADSRKLYDKNFTDVEIKKEYKKNQERIAKLQKK